jgi:hypothetical protein
MGGLTAVKECSEADIGAEFSPTEYLLGLFLLSIHWDYLLSEHPAYFNIT